MACACAVGPSGNPSQVGIVKQEYEVNPDGSYHYTYESEDGQGGEQKGSLKTIGNEAGISAEGSYHYTAPDGTPISVQYVADENGYQAKGDHIPVAPEVPLAIARALDYIKANPYVEEKHQKKTGGRS